MTVKEIADKYGYKTAWEELFYQLIDKLFENPEVLEDILELIRNR